MEEKDLICINCPLGCPLTVTLENGEVKAVAGNTCPRGEAYARKELTNPTRIVTSTVKVKGGMLAMASVKTAGDIPKGKIFDCVKAIQDMSSPPLWPSARWCWPTCAAPGWTSWPPRTCPPRAEGEEP